MRGNAIRESKVFLRKISPEKGNTACAMYRFGWLYNPSYGTKCKQQNQAHQ